MTSKISQARPCRPAGLEANVGRENPQTGEAAVKGARTSVRFTSGTRSASAKQSAAGPRAELKRNKFRAPKNRRGLRRFGQRSEERRVGKVCGCRWGREEGM